MKRLSIVALGVALLAGWCGLMFAQPAGNAAQNPDSVTVEAKPLTDSDIALLRQDVQTGKNDLINKTMQFSAAEAASFWPVYKNYADEQKKIGDIKYALIKDYAANYDGMTDAKAAELSRKMLDIEKQTVNLRVKYLPLFEKALSQKRAAMFMQVDRRLSLITDLQLASIIPILGQ